MTKKLPPQFRQIRATPPQVAIAEAAHAGAVVGLLGNAVPLVPLQRLSTMHIERAPDGTVGDRPDDQRRDATGG